MDSKGRSTLDFASDLDLAEIVRLAKSRQKLSGAVNIAGNSKFDGTLLELRNVRVRGFGGELTGEANIEEFTRYHANAKLSGLNLQGLEQRLGMTPLPYDGTISGTLEAEGNVRAPGGGLQSSRQSADLAGKPWSSNFRPNRCRVYRREWNPQGSRFLHRSSTFPLEFRRFIAERVKGWNSHLRTWPISSPLFPARLRRSS